MNSQQLRAALKARSYEPCTGEPAQDSEATVVEVVMERAGSVLVRIDQQPIEAVDFYKLEAA